MKKIREFLDRYLPDFCFLIFALAATIGAFTGGIWAAFGIGLSLIAFIAVWLIERRMPKPDIALLYFILAFLAACALLNLHSWQPKLSWVKWEELITIFLPLSLLTASSVQKHAGRKRLFAILPWLVMIGAAALGVELSLGAPLLKWKNGQGTLLSQYNRGFSYLVLLAFPVMAALWTSKRRWMIVPFILILLFPASLTELRAAKLALVLGLIVVLAAHYMPTITRRLLGIAPFLVIGWPLAAQTLFLAHHDWIKHLPHSWEDRMEIWDYMSYRVFEKPWLGWGLGSSPKLPFAQPNGALYRVELYGAPHPHNALIQLWVELGVPGVAFGILFALHMLLRTGRLKPALAPFACGAWMAGFSLAMIAYDFWTDSFWAAFALTGFAFALLHRQIAEKAS